MGVIIGVGADGLDLSTSSLRGKWLGLEGGGEFTKTYFQGNMMEKNEHDWLKDSHILPTGQRYAPSAVNFSAYSAHSA